MGAGQGRGEQTALCRTAGLLCPLRAPPSGVKIRATWPMAFRGRPGHCCSTSWPYRRPHLRREKRDTLPSYRDKGQDGGFRRVGSWRQGWGGGRGLKQASLAANTGPSVSGEHQAGTEHGSLPHLRRKAGHYGHRLHELSSGVGCKRTGPGQGPRAGPLQVLTHAPTHARALAVYKPGLQKPGLLSGLSPLPGAHPSSARLAWEARSTKCSGRPQEGNMGEVTSVTRSLVPGTLEASPP